MIRSDVAVIFSAAMALAVAACPARGQFSEGPGPGPQANIDGFAVVGKGTAAAKPNRLEIDLEVSAASELTADAIVKYRDAKKRLQDAFAALKMSNVAVEERGLLVDQKGQAFNPYYMDMPPARKGKVEVQLTRKLVVSVSEHPHDGRRGPAPARGQAAGRGPGRRRQGRRRGGFQSVLLLPVQRSGRQARPVHPRRFRRAPGEGLRRGDRRRPGEGRRGWPSSAASSSAASRASARSWCRARSLRGDGVLLRRQPHRNDEEVPRKRLESSRFQEIPVRVELHGAVRPGRVAEGREAEVRNDQSRSSLPDRHRSGPAGASSCGAAASGSPPLAGGGLAVARRRARPGEGGPAQARDARDAPGRDQGAGLPRRAAGRGRVVDHRRRPGVSGRDDRPGRDGLPGPRELADAGQVFARTSRGPSSSSSGAARRPG